MWRKIPFKNLSKERYDECLEAMAEGLDIHFQTTKTVCFNLQTGKYPLPKLHEKRKIIYQSKSFDIYKSPDDPFDIIYCVSFGMQQKGFANIFENCLASKGIKFDFVNNPYKQEIFDDFALLLKAYYGFSPKITVVEKKVEFKIAVILSVKIEHEEYQVGDIDASNNRT